jgi:hypothetical protein
MHAPSAGELLVDVVRTRELLVEVGELTLSAVSQVFEARAQSIE